MSDIDGNKSHATSNRQAQRKSYLVRSAVRSESKVCLTSASFLVFCDQTSTITKNKQRCNRQRQRKSYLVRSAVRSESKVCLFVGWIFLVFCDRCLTSTETKVMPHPTDKHSANHIWCALQCAASPKCFVCRLDIPCFL